MICLFIVVPDISVDVDEYDSDFWEPVKVTTSIDKFPVSIVDNYECAICSDLKNRMIRLPCCSGNMCYDCGKSWFEKESSKCPYCRKDV